MASGLVRGAGGTVGGLGPAGTEFGGPVGAGGDEEEPELEDVGEEDEDVSAGAGGEGDEADESPAEESEGDASLPARPLEGDDEEEPDVDLVDPLVPLLVVGESTEVDGLSDEEVGEVDEDGDESADEGPAQDRQGAGDADQSDDEAFHRGRLEVVGEVREEINKGVREGSPLRPYGAPPPKGEVLGVLVGAVFEGVVAFEAAGDLEDGSFADVKGSVADSFEVVGGPDDVGDGVGFLGVAFCSGEAFD